MSARTCPNCGHPLSANAQFCVNCGKAIPETVVEITPAEQVPWTAREGIGIFLIAFVLFAILLFVLSAFIPNADSVVAIGIIANDVLLFATTLLWVRKVHHVGVRSLGLRDFTARNVGIGALIGVAGVFISGIISVITAGIVERIVDHPLAPPKQIPLEHDPSGGLLIILGIGTVLCAPIAEETFFRGFVFRGMRKWMRPVPAMLLSAGFFAAAHIIPIVLLPIFALGILLAAVVERRDSIVPAIAAHVAFNTFGFVVGYVLKK